MKARITLRLDLGLADSPQDSYNFTDMFRNAKFLSETFGIGSIDVCGAGLCHIFPVILCFTTFFHCLSRSDLKV